MDRGLQQFAPRYPDLRPGASNNPVLGGADKYFDPTAFVLQPAGYIGNLGRNTLIGPGLFTLDVVVERSIRLGAGGDRALQLRLEAFNLTNRVNLALPSSVSWSFTVRRSSATRTRFNSPRCSRRSIILVIAPAS